MRYRLLYHLPRTRGLNIMVDRGLTQGDDRSTPITDWPISPKDIGLHFPTHAHIDHIGRLPELTGHEIVKYSR